MEGLPPIEVDVEMEEDPQVDYLLQTVKSQQWVIELMKAQVQEATSSNWREK